MPDYTTTPSALTEYTIDRPGCTVHYWLGGEADRPLVVMMHGATMDHRMFNAQVTALLPEYRVLVWDARAHGKSLPNTADISLESFVQDMLAILDELGVAQVILMGQSLGGYIAQQLYKIAPQRVQAMIIIGSTPIAKAYSKLEIWTLKATLPLFNVWPHGHFTKVVANNTTIKEDVRAYALQAVQHIPREDFLRIWKAVTLAIDSQGKPDFHITVPLLLVHGDQDKTGTIKRDMPIWPRIHPQAEYHVIPDAGHNANQDNPTVMNDLLLAFLHAHMA
ncbi:alpha/beta hydrolase [Phototrophicus methaneseepsis]|uniref:Alpha/beta hydrolase n=1 Tax=Phototrophicus methaneseepsis TaxID=2710758 RepID=A0A7S8ECN0_9CHLR|nr:alpha/beta hydrolase [Phototrophicus methaneseepsis]QPC84512.1 alpha/beta hydrolase [Phototrophicus methaneseepsis]